MEYIHFNPVKAGFIRKPEYWRYSSAINYLDGEGLIPITYSLDRLVGAGAPYFPPKQELGREV